MRFLPYKICFSEILYLKKWLLWWPDFVENESVSIPREFAVVLNNIYLVILSSQKNVMYHFFSSKFDIHGNANACRARCHGHELLYKT